MCDGGVWKVLEGDEGLELRVDSLELRVEGNFSFLHFLEYRPLTSERSDNSSNSYRSIK